jgi:TonB family protein
VKNVRVFLAAILGLFLCTPVFSDEKFQLILRKAEAGDLLAQVSIAEIFNVGSDKKKIPRDYIQSTKWLRKAAEQGHAKSVLKLAKRYEEGIGVLRNDKEALECYRKAANLGLAEAQNILGNLHSGRKKLSGVKLPKNNFLAIEYYSLAAKQGNPDAQSSLGENYEYGKGFKENRLKAYAWYSLSNFNGKGSDISNYGMTEKEVSEAQALSSEFLKDMAKAAEDVMADAKTVKAAEAEAKWAKANPEAAAAKAAAARPSVVSKPSVISKPRPKYPPNARRSGQQGTVTLFFTVGSSGTVISARIKKSSGYAALDNAALSAIRSWRFKPARNALGEAVSYSYNLPVPFRLQ